MERLEDSVAKITSVLQTIHQEVQGLSSVKEDVRALRAAQQTNESVDGEASEALNRLESVIYAAHQHFAQIDSDGNGLLDLKELGGAMAALGVLPEGEEAAFEDISKVMHKYDTDGNGGLDKGEFAAFVHDMAANGKLRLREDLVSARR